MSRSAVFFWFLTQHLPRRAESSPRRGVALLAVALTACGAGGEQLDRQIDRAGVSVALVARQRALVAEGDRLWAGRTDPDRLAEALQRWESAVAIRDDDWRTYARLARGYFFQADAFFAFEASGGSYPYRPGGDGERDAEAGRRYQAAHRRGLAAALRGLAARSREFEQRIEGGIGLDKAILVVRKDAAALIYWYVANLGRWARTAGVSALLRSRSAILACLFHLRRIDPDYEYGGADRLLGVYYAAAPGFAGGDLSQSRAHFDAASRAAPGDLATAVLAAEFLDRKAGDRASFEERLRGVIAQVRDTVPELAPENAVERRKARALLERADRYFHR